MIRTGITITSLGFAIVVFLWSQLHWHYLDERNMELEARITLFSAVCPATVERNKKLEKEKIALAQKMSAILRNRPGRKKAFAELKKLIKARNIKFGIGGN